tara:strand:+ start:314 stop:997 length:684 start_codon:yes stop_codon:yes gene_type:complete
MSVSISKPDPLKFCMDCINMLYYKNECAVSGAPHNKARHEDAIENLLVANNFKKYIPEHKLIVKEREKLYIDPSLRSDIPDGSYITQPYGKNNNPDFIVKVNNKILFVEAKSSKGAKPLYNSGGCHSNYLYVFCCEKYNKTTIYKGEYVITDKQSTIFNKVHDEFQQIANKWNEKLKECDEYNRGWTIYPRDMIKQLGGNIKTDYFQHKEKENVEEKTLDWIKQTYQ